MTQHPKVLYLFAGKRGDFYQKFLKGEVADTQLLGLNHMKELGADAEFKEWGVAEFLRKINFNLTHLPYIFTVWKYDIVFICAGLPLVFLAKYILRLKKPKFVIYNTYLTNAIKRHPKGLIHFINKKAIQNLDAIVCTATSQKEFLLSRGFDPAKIFFHPIGIDTDFWSRTSNSSPSAPDYIISVGRDPGRDYKTLFEAVKDLQVKVIVATKPEAVRGLTIPKNVEVRFHIPYEKMPSLYAGANFAVVPLRDAENPDGSDTSGQYGFLEPMAMGKAVIATDKATVRDYLKNGQNGLLVAPQSPEALKKAIETLLHDSEKKSSLGGAGKLAVSERFTSQKFAEFLSKVFVSL